MTLDDQSCEPMQDGIEFPWLGTDDDGEFVVTPGTEVEPGSTGFWDQAVFNTGFLLGVVMIDKSD